MEDSLVTQIRYGTNGALCSVYACSTLHFTYSGCRTVVILIVAVGVTIKCLWFCGLITLLTLLAEAEYGV